MCILLRGAFNKKRTLWGVRFRMYSRVLVVINEQESGLMSVQP